MEAEGTAAHLTPGWWAVIAAGEWESRADLWLLGWALRSHTICKAGMGT